MNIDLWSIGWHVLSVFFLALLFKHFLFKPVRTFMDNNAKKVMEDRQQLEVVKQEITIQQNQVKAQKEELRAHSAETLTRSQKQAEELAKDVIATAEKEADRIRRRATEEAEQLRIKAMEDSEERIGSLSVELAGRILSREIKKEDHERMIDAFIKEVAEK